MSGVCCEVGGKVVVFGCLLCVGVCWLCCGLCLFVLCGMFV